MKIYNYIPLLLFALFLSFTQTPAWAEAWPHRDQLRSEIRFWKDIFTKYDDTRMVLHDPYNLALVYKTISLSPYDTAAGRERRTLAAKYEIENSLRNLADCIEAGRAPSAQEKSLLALFGPSVSAQHIRICASRIRGQQGISNRFYQGLQRSTAYLPSLKKIFRDAGLPEELAYLPHIESSFNLTARSKAGAAGMWQFIKPAAKTFSLKMNSFVDERYDPLAASQAAAVLLKNNYEQLNDWGLALTAYNYGLRGMYEAAQSCGGDYMSVRRKFKGQRFKFASKNFYPEFLAAVEIMEKPEAYFPEYSPKSKYTVVQHRLQQPATLPALAKKWGVETAGLRQLNPGYSKKAWDGRLTVPAGYSVNIFRGHAVDSGQLASADEKQAKFPKKKQIADAAVPKAVKKQLKEPAPKEIQQQTSPQQAKAAPEVVRAGAADELSLESLRTEIAPVLAVNRKSIQIFGDETLGHIAQWLKLSPQSLCKLNKTSPKKALRQRQKLQLDFSRTTQDEFTQARLAYHLSAIDALLRKHNLDQLIKYRMNARDSLHQIASRQFKIPASLIVYFNSGQNLNNLAPGSVIRIPVSREAALHVL